MSVHNETDSEIREGYVPRKLPCIRYIKSESRGQEEAGLRDEPVSYLQVAPL